MAFSAHHTKYTYAEYLRLERMANVRHEYLDGQIYAMAGGTPEHAALCANVIASLSAQLRGRPCRVHSTDLRVRVRATGLATYPDITVLCGQFEADPDDHDAAANPTLVCEVLSPSTEEYDRGDKFDHYKRIASLREVVFVSHDARRIESFARQADGSWSRTTAGEGGVLPLDSLQCRLEVDDVYRDALTGGWLA